MAILRRKPEDCLSIELNLGDGGRVPAVFPGSTVYGRIRCPATQYTDRGVSLDLTGEEGVEHADGCFSYLGNKKFNRKVKLFLNGPATTRLRSPKSGENTARVDIPFEAEIPHSATPSFESAFDSQNIAYVRYFLVARNTAAKTSATLEIAVHPLPAPFPPPQTRHFPVDRPTENGVFASKTCSRSWLCLLPRRSVGLEMRLAMQSFAQLSQFSFAVAVSNAQRVRYLKASVVKVLSCRGYSAAFVVASEKFHPEHLDLGGLEGGCRKTLNVRFLVDESCAPSFRGQFLRLDYYVVVKARVGLFEEVRVERRVFVEAAREFLRPEVFGGGRRLEGVCGRVCGKDGNCEPAREEAKAESESLAGPVPPPIPPQFIIPPLIPRNFGDAPISGVSSPDSTFVTASGRFQTPISTPEPFPSIIVPPPIPSDSLSSGGCEEKGFLTRYPPLFQAMPMARFLGGGQRQVFCNPRASLWRMGNETKEVNSAGEKHQR